MYQDIEVKNSSGFVSEQVESPDYLLSNGYRVDIPNCPILSQTITKCILPKMALGSAKQMTPQVSIPHIGDGIVVGSFVVEFPVLSDLSNYMEVYTWLMRMLSEDLVSQTSKEMQRYNGAALATNPKPRNPLDLSSLYTDASVIVYDRNNNSVASFVFRSMFPVDLSEINLDALSSSQDPIKATVTFKYIVYEVKKLNT